jgi:hypothetical protein
MTNAERERVEGFGRLEDGLRGAGDWYLWGPYLSERQWGTVREDYSADGNPWILTPWRLQSPLCEPAFPQLTGDHRSSSTVLCAGRLSMVPGRGSAP